MLVAYIILISFINNKTTVFYNHYACIGKGGGLLWLETEPSSSSQQLLAIVMSTSVESCRSCGSTK